MENTQFYTRFAVAVTILTLMFALGNARSVSAKGYHQNKTNELLSTATLYYSPSCSHCKIVLRYLNQENIHVRKKNIANPQDRSEFKRLGRSGVPVLVHGSKVISGSTAIIAYLKTQE